MGTGRPYRAPELLFGPRMYDAKAIDLWAVGAVMAELLGVSSPSLEDDSLSKVDEPDSDFDADPLEMRVTPGTKRRSLFDDSYGSLGLAASIFRLRGSPTSLTWPVSFPCQYFTKINEVFRNSALSRTRRRSNSRLSTHSRYLRS